MHPMIKPMTSKRIFGQEFTVQYRILMKVIRHRKIRTNPQIPLIRSIQVAIQVVAIQAVAIQVVAIQVVAIQVVAIQVVAIQAVEVKKEVVAEIRRLVGWKLFRRPFSYAVLAEIIPLHHHLL
jgi:hypothetical protein